MSDWPTVTLREAGVTLIDCDHKTPKAQETGLPYVGIPQLKEGRITLDGARLISEEDFYHWRRKSKPTPNDVILSRRCNPGETAYVPEGLEIALGQNLVLLRSDGEKLYPPFLRWVVQGSNWWNQVGKFINVGAVFDSLKCVDIPNFEIQLPPMDSQVQIAEILGSIDKKIELNRQTNQTLEQIAQAIFKSWFVDFEPVKTKIEAKQNGQDPERAAMRAISGKTDVELDQLSPEQRQQLTTTAAFFPDELENSELGEIPKGWSSASLYETAEYINGAAFKASDFSPNNEGLPIIKIAELKAGIIPQTKYTTKKVADKYYIDDDEMLYSWSGSPGTSLEVFKWFGGKAILNQHIFRVITEAPEQKYFVFYLLRYLKPKLIAIAENKQTTGLGHVTVADMKRLKILQPEVNVLREFGRVVGRLYEKSSVLDRQMLTLAETRDTLLPELLCGGPDNENKKAAV